MKRFFTHKFIIIAWYHIDKANGLIQLKSNNICIYGSYYKDTLQYAFLDLHEKLHLLLYNFWNSLIDKKYEKE